MGRPRGSVYVFVEQAEASIKRHVWAAAIATAATCLIGRAAAAMVNRHRR